MSRFPVARAVDNYRMSQQGGRSTGHDDDWWGQLYDDSAQDAGPTAAADSLDDRFASAAGAVGRPGAAGAAGRAEGGRGGERGDDERTGDGRAARSRSAVGAEWSATWDLWDPEDETPPTPPAQVPGPRKRTERGAPGPAPEVSGSASGASGSASGEPRSASGSSEPRPEPSGSAEGAAPTKAEAPGRDSGRLPADPPGPAPAPSPPGRPSDRSSGQQAVQPAHRSSPPGKASAEPSPGPVSFPPGPLPPGFAERPPGGPEGPTAATTGASPGTERPSPDPRSGTAAHSPPAASEDTPAVDPRTAVAAPGASRPPGPSVPGGAETPDRPAPTASDGTPGRSRHTAPDGTPPRSGHAPDGPPSATAEADAEGPLASSAAQDPLADATREPASAVRRGQAADEWPVDGPSRVPVLRDYVGSGPPTYEPEPTALPPAEPDGLDDLVPDTVLDGARYGTCTLRAVSLRGDSARYRGEPRRDALLTARFGTGDQALVLVAMATGARAAPGAHRAAADVCGWIARAVGRSHARLVADLRAARRGDLKSGLHRLTDRSLGRLRAGAVDQGVEPEEYSATLRCLLLPADPHCRTRVFFGVGAGGLFRLRDGGWQDIEPGTAQSAGEPAAGAGGQPHGPAHETFRFRASVARPGDTLLLCSGGLADPLRGEPALSEYLAGRWSGRTPPGLAAFLADSQVRVKGYADDRTAAAVWEA